MTSKELGHEYDSFLDSLNDDYCAANQGWTPEEIEAAKQREAALWAQIAALEALHPPRPEVKRVKLVMPKNPTYTDVLKVWGSW